MRKVWTLLVGEDDDGVFVDIEGYLISSRDLPPLPRKVVLTELLTLAAKHLASKEENG